LTERGGLVPVDPVPKLDHLPLVVGQALNRLAKGPIAQAQGNLLRGTAALVLDELAQRCSVLVADRPAEAGDDPGEIANPLDRGGLELCLLGDLLGRRVAPQLRRQLALDPHHLALALGDLVRDANRALLRLEGALDRLPDPEGRVGRELVALAVVELLAGAD